MCLPVCMYCLLVHQTNGSNLSSTTDKLWASYLLLVYCCITNYSKTWWLKTATIALFLLTVSVGWEFRKRLVGSVSLMWLK